MAPSCVDVVDIRSVYVDIYRRFVHVGLYMCGRGMGFVNIYVDLLRKVDENMKYINSGNVTS